MEYVIIVAVHVIPISFDILTRITNVVGGGLAVEFLEGDD